MADILIKCTSCKNAVQHTSAKELPCKHVLCLCCFSMSTKQNSIRCPCCSKYFNIQDSISPVVQKSEILKNSPQNFYQSIQSQIQSEIKILDKMLLETQQTKIHTIELFKQYDEYITQSFSGLYQMLETIHQSLRAKIEECRDSNQNIINLSVNNLNNLLEKRKNIEQKVAEAEIKGQNLDFNTQIEINSLEIVSPLDFNIYKFEFARDFADIGNNIGQLIINEIQFPCHYIKIVPEYLEEPQKIEEVLKNNDESNELQKSFEKLMNNNNEIQYVEECNPPDIIHDPKIKIKIEVKEYANVNDDEINLKENSKSEPFFNNKDDPACEWFIMVKEDLKPLPDFACKQIDRHKHSKDKIYIKRDNQIKNIADIKNQIYYIADKNGNPVIDKSHKLIFIPRN